MKKLLIFISLPLLLSLTSNKSKTTLRWGLIGEKHNIVFDETEVLVGEWLEYICYNNPLETPQYLKMWHVKRKHLTKSQIKLLQSKFFPTDLLPDTTIIKTLEINYLFKKRQTTTLIDYKGLDGSVLLPIDSIFYIQNKKKVRQDLNRPITGISYEQALSFCKWRTRNDHIKFVNKKSSSDSIFLSHSEYFEFHLPTREEFEMINTKKDSLNKFSKFNYKGAIKRSNKYPYIKCGETTVTPWHILFNNSFYYPPKFIFSGMQHVQGNAAEMSNIKGESYGGSYFHFANKSYNDSPTLYASPQPWLGFRCVGKKLGITHR